MFEIVGRYENLVDAHIALGRLTSEGIAAHLIDAQMVQQDPLAGLAIGGIKLRVASGDAPRARALLARDDSQLLDDVDIGDDRAGKPGSEPGV